MITGDPRVFANRTYLNLRYPRPIYDMPTAAHARAAFLSNVSYVKLNEGFDEANSYAMGQGFLLDEELTTNVGVVAHHPLTNQRDPAYYSVLSESADRADGPIACA